MRILHYTLGLPPARSGGLTQYSFDLMLEQVRTDQVYLLYPGHTSFRKTSYIKKTKSYSGIFVYEIVNPIIVPLLHGVKKSEYILRSKKIDERNVLDFINLVNPDVIHIHTLMGLSLSILEMFKKLNIRIVFSTHDYYGLCLKTNFINSGGLSCDYYHSSCAECNVKAPNKLFLYLRNNKLILKFKSVFRKICSHQMRANLNEITYKRPVDNDRENSFLLLHKYYLSMFSLVDFFYYNSTVSKEIYLKYIGLKGEVFHVTNSSIGDNRKKKEFSQHFIRLLFIGSAKAYKGLSVLLDVLRKMDLEKINNWQLDIWGNNEQIKNLPVNVFIRGTFKNTDISSIYKSADLLVVPSIWNETFSLVTLEALSYGVPVLLSSTVGAKDIIAKYNEDFIYSSSEELYLKLRKILTDVSLLTNFNDSVCVGSFDYTMEKHSNEIRKLYIQSNNQN